MRRAHPLSRRRSTEVDTTVPGMTAIGTDWRVVDGVATAWFDAPSLIEGAALAGRIVELSADIAVDVRASGTRVRLDSDEKAEMVSAAAQDLGLAANPAVLQQLSVVVESVNPTAVRQFWERVLPYAPGEGGGLVDPQRRDSGATGTLPEPVQSTVSRFGIVIPDGVDQPNLGQSDQNRTRINRNPTTVGPTGPLFGQADQPEGSQSHSG